MTTSRSEADLLALDAATARANTSHVRNVGSSGTGRERTARVDECEGAAGGKRQKVAPPRLSIPRADLGHETHESRERRPTPSSVLSLPSPNTPNSVNRLIQ